MERSNFKLEETDNKMMDNQEDKNYIQKNEENENNRDIENTKKNVEKSKIKKKKNILPVIIMSIIVLIGIIFSTIFALININNNNIVSGVKIKGIDVSGLSREEAKSKIELIYNEKNQNDIVLKYEEYESTINAEVLETKYDIENAIEEAISVGRSSNIVINNYNILFALFGKKNININMTINEEIANQIIEDIEQNIPNAVVEADYYIENDKLIITKGKEGLKVDTQNLIEKIKDRLKSIEISQDYIEIPVISKIPENIDIEKIHKEICKEVQDAYYTKEPFTIYPEVEGVEFNIEEAKKILEEDKEKYEIQLTITKPNVTTAQIGSEAFPDLLGTCSTRYDASNIDRSTNLKIACQKINDKVILPGEEFSYNKALGERTIAAGYKNAKVYENGQVVDGIGGGICQISSTLYNAILKANMEATERRNHMFITSYIPAGQDATVVYGLTDFKFKNTRKYAVKIQANCSNGIATVSVYGIKEENEYVVSFNTKTISTIPYTVKYVEDSSLPVGKEQISQIGANGAITETYIVKSLNGKVVSSKLLSKDTYNAMQRIILKGTKGAKADTNSNSNINSNNNSNNNANTKQPDNDKLNDKQGEKPTNTDKSNGNDIEEKDLDKNLDKQENEKNKEN